MASPNPKPPNVGEGATITTVPDSIGVNHFQFRPVVPMFGGADHTNHFDETAPPALERMLSWEDLEGPDGALAEDNEEWECTRCTFRNSSLVRTCDLCEAPRFAKAMLVSNSPEDTIRTNPNPTPQSSIFNTMEDFLQGASAFPALPSELKLSETKSDLVPALPEPLKLSLDEPTPISPQAPEAAAASDEREVLPSPVAPPESPVDVIFIGAGPVGLWAALQVKVHRPNWRVLLLEKHQEYQRKHVLKINLSSFDHARTLKNTLLNNLIDSLQAYVRTSDLEAKLRLAALHLGIEIRFESVTSIAQVIKQYPSVSIIVGTDGSHSIVRQQIFGGQLAIQESLQHIVDFKYEVQGRAMKMRFFDQAYPTLKLMSHVVDEHVGKFSEAEGTTPVTLRLLIDPETYNRVKDATFKNPFYVPTHREQLGEKLVESLTIWLNAKSMLVGEVRVPGSERLSALHLSVYRSTTLAAIRTVENTDGKPRAFCLAGDSAFGVPFFRALNNGLICGSQLAAALTVGQLTNPRSPTAEDMSQPCTVPTEHALSAYQHFVEQLAEREIGVARRKKALLSLAQLTSKVNSMVPWQVVRWSDDKVRAFKTMNPGFSAPASALPPPGPDGENKNGDANGAPSGATARCKFCGTLFTGETNRRGQCAHRGALHSLYAHCNAMCAVKLSFTGHSIPSIHLARNHWGCCYALEDQKWCPQSGPHAADIVQCTLCFRNVDPFNNLPGGCGHTGTWHDTWSQCGVTCAAKMSITQYGHNHWSCCYSTDHESPCKNSPPHILAPHNLVETRASVCRKCGLPFDPMHNASGQCAHIDDWHTSVTQCSVKCVKGLGFQNIGKQHWGCCFSTAHASMCKKSDVHEA